MIFLQLRQEPGIYSQLTEGMSLQNSCSAMSGLLSCCEDTIGILLEPWQGNRDASRGEAGDPGSLSSYRRDIGIPFNFQEESSIISF